MPRKSPRAVKQAANLAKKIREWEDWRRDLKAWKVKEFGLTPEMQKSLAESDDDWSFIIKIHALLEAALSQIILGKLGVFRDLAELLSELNVGGGKGSKIQVARALGAFPTKAIKFVDLISGTRKKLVHGCKHFDFDLSAHVKGLKPNEQRDFQSAVFFDLLDEQGVEQLKPWQADGIRSLALAHPRKCIYGACLHVLIYSFNAQPGVVDLYHASPSPERQASAKRRKSKPTE